MQMILPDGGTVAAVRVVPSDFHIDSRVRGFLDAFGTDEKFTITTFEVDSRDAGLLSRSIPARLLIGTQRIRGVFVSNAWTHAVIRHLLQHTRHRDLRVIGYALIQENCQCLEQGVIDFLISQRPAMQGYGGIMALYRSIVLRERVTREIVMPIDIVTRDSYQYYHD